MPAITANGFVAKNFKECKDDLILLFRKIWPELNIDSASPSGQLIDLLSRQEHSLWQAIQDVYNASNPNTAANISLDYLANQKNITRFQKERANALIQVFYDSSVHLELPANFEVSSRREGWIFATDESLSLDIFSISAAYITAEDNFIGVRQFQIMDGLPLITITGQEGAQEALQSLQSVLASRGYECQLFTAQPPTDFDFDFESAPILEIQFQSSRSLMTVNWMGFQHRVLAKRIFAYRNEPTATAVIAGMLNRMISPPDGVLAAFNTQISSRGRNRETDTELRERMTRRVVSGLATKKSIEFHVLNDVAGVTFVKVSTMFNTPFVEGKKNMIHVLVEGGIEADIVAKIAEVKGAGIYTYNQDENTLGGYYEGTGEEIWFDRPRNVAIQLKVIFSYDGTEAVIGGFQAAIGLDFIEFLHQIQTIGNRLIANKFLKVLYSYPGFGASWCNLKRADESEDMWRKELDLTSFERAVLEFSSIVWELRE